MKKLLFILIGLACTALPLLSRISPQTFPKFVEDNAAPVALTAGILLALFGLTPFPQQAKKLSRLLIQSSVVLLGFSISLGVVVDAGLPGLAFAAGTIVGAMALGFALGRVLNTDIKTTALLSTGTAICGGSAIAAAGPAIRASDAQMSVSLACVFMLNAVALYVFPPLGHAIGLSEHQFGAWAAVAIHDVSSVVGAAKQYGDVALADATVIKLTRALWIAPVALAMRWIVLRHAAPEPAGGDEAKKKPAAASAFPWFILLFIGASAVRTAAPAIKDFGEALKPVAKTGMVAALFLIGSGLSVKAMKQVGWRPLLQAVLLWVTLSVAALIVVRATVAP